MPDTPSAAPVEPPARPGPHPRHPAHRPARRRGVPVRRESSFGPNQIALVLGTAVAGLVGLANGQSWAEIEGAIKRGIATSMGAVLILLVVGSVIGTWILAGIVPTMIHYGLSLLAPSIFYAATCAICAVVALATGSSWTTAGTVGLALIGTAAAYDLHPGIAAGATISGAYFGDKMSPLSNTTNLAPAVAGSELFTHIRHMVWTTAPSRMPAFPAMMYGALVGGVFTVVFQPEAVLRAVGEPELARPVALVKGVWQALHGGYVLDSGNAALDELPSRGGGHPRHRVRHQRPGLRPVHLHRAPGPDVPQRVPAAAARLQEPVADHRGLGHDHLRTHPLEHLRGVHGPDSGRLDADLRALRLLQPDQPARRRPLQASRGSASRRWIRPGFNLRGPRPSARALRREDRGAKRPPRRWTGPTKSP